MTPPPPRPRSPPKICPASTDVSRSSTSSSNNAGRFCPHFPRSFFVDHRVTPEQLYRGEAPLWVSSAVISYSTPQQSILGVFVHDTRYYKIWDVAMLDSWMALYRRLDDEILRKCQLGDEEVFEQEMRKTKRHALLYQLHGEEGKLLEHQTEMVKLELSHHQSRCLQDWTGFFLEQLEEVLGRVQISGLSYVQRLLEMPQVFYMGMEGVGIFQHHGLLRRDFCEVWFQHMLDTFALTGGLQELFNDLARQYAEQFNMSTVLRLELEEAPEGMPGFLGEVRLVQEAREVVGVSRGGSRWGYRGSRGRLRENGKPRPCGLGESKASTSCRLLLDPFAEFYH